MDASVIVHLISTGTNDTYTYSSMIDDCRNIMRSFITTTIKHVFREANCCADLLAKWGAETEEEGLKVFNDQPAAIAKLVENDCRAFCLPRFINSRS